MREIPYDRAAAVNYARRWAMGRNSVYYNFEKQLGTSSGDFYHSPVITAVSPTILVAAHTFDALDRPLSSYVYDQARFLHIDGVRVW